MKKFSSFIGIVLLSTFCLAGCGKTIPYRPNVNEIYYKYNDNYRIIELVSNEPEIINDFPILNLAQINDPKIFVRLYIDIDGKFVENSIFFRDGVNIEGAFKIHNLFHNTNNLSDSFFSCNELQLYTLNKRISIKMDPYILYSEGKHNGIAYGEVATVNAYTFNYVDRSPKNGQQVGEGNFKVYICGPTVFKEFYLPGYGEK